jgi:hypothetical protein
MILFIVMTCPLDTACQTGYQRLTVTQRGHFIAINGYRVTRAQKQFVSITDPMYGSSEIDFAQFASGHGGYRDGRGVWYASFLVANMKAS